MAAIVLQFRSETAAAKNAMASLATSVATNMSSIAGVMGSTALTTVAATSAMGGGFGNAALAAGRFLLQYRLLIGTLAVVGLAISSAARGLDDLVSIGDKASAIKLSPETFQAFTREAELSKIAIKDAEAALTAFNNSNKARFDPSNEKRASGPSPLGKYLEDLKLIQGELQNSQALDKFLNAGNNDEKLRATIGLVKELQAAGLNLAATGFAEKAFGGAGEKIAEEIRKGKFELDSLTEQGKAAGLIFSNELVQRAVELRDRLEKASREIGDNLKPLLEGSVTVGLALGGALTAGVEAAVALSKAVNQVYQSLVSAAAAAVDLIARLGQVGSAQSQNQANILQAKLSDPGLSPSQRRGLEDQQRALRGQQQLRDNAIPDIPLPGIPRKVDANGVVETGRNVIIPGPEGRPSGIDKVARGGGGGSAASEEPDKRLKEIEAFIKALEKANRLAEAELLTVGKSNAEKEKGAALAKIGGDLTDEQRQKIEQLAESTAKFRDKQKEVEEALRRTGEAGQFAFGAIGDAINDAVFNGTKLSKVAENLIKSLGSTALKGLLTGQGPFGIGGNGILGALGLFGGARAEGGPVSTGRAYLVGERGPEIFVPGASGSIIPNGGGRGSGGSVGGGGPAHIMVTLSDDLDARIRSTSQDVAVRVSRAGIDSNNRSFQKSLDERQLR
jgi:hypothetical protein